MYSLFTLATPSFLDACDLAGICPTCGENIGCRCDDDEALIANADLEHDSDRALELAASWADATIALAKADPNSRGWALACADTLDADGYHILAVMVRSAV